MSILYMGYSHDLQSKCLLENFIFFEVRREWKILKLLLGGHILLDMWGKLAVDNDTKLMNRLDNREGLKVEEECLAYYLMKC